MNLEDYAYNEDDRWYVNPQVSLDEQNAFINNLRNLQAQDNAQITQQTRGLGTQIPSNLGGLVGGGSYFRSRYQTPQTNKTIADLRAVAQNQALQTALNNELEKAKKKYRDSQNNALKKNGLNDVPLTVTDAGGEGDKYKTEYKGSSLKGEVKPGSGLYAIPGIGGVFVGEGTVSRKMDVDPELLRKNLEDLGVSTTDFEAMKQGLRNKGYMLYDDDAETLAEMLGIKTTNWQGFSSLLGGE